MHQTKTRTKQVWMRSGDVKFIPVSQANLISIFDMEDSTEDENGSSAQTDCPTCDGRGYTECWHCGSEEDCEDCDGSGLVDELAQKLKTIPVPRSQLPLL